MNCCYKCKIYEKLIYFSLYNYNRPSTNKWIKIKINDMEAVAEYYLKIFNVHWWCTHHILYINDFCNGRSAQIYPTDSTKLWSKSRPIEHLFLSLHISVAVEKNRSVDLSQFALLHSAHHSAGAEQATTSRWSGA